MADAHREILQNVQQSVSLICADAAKSFLRHGTSAASSTVSDSEICHFLAAHFEAAAEAKRRENRLCVSHSDIAEITRWIFTSKSDRFAAVSPAVTAALRTSKEQQQQDTILNDAAAAMLIMPRISQRDITSFMESRKMNTGALPEAFEMCRALNQLAQKHAAGSQKKATLLDSSSKEGSATATAAAFGTVNAIQFLAVFSSLALVRSFFELFALVNESASNAMPQAAGGGSSSIASAVTQMCCASWAFIDPSHAAVWKAAVKLMAFYPGTPIPLLLELIPSVESMGMAASTFIDDVDATASASASGSSPASGGGANIVSYNPDDEESSMGNQQQQQQQQKVGGSGDEEQEDEEDENEQDVRARQDFWAGLTA